MYRVAVESLLGFEKVGDTLRIQPCVPSAWSAYQITYRHHSATYVIDVRTPAAIQLYGATVAVDGTVQADGRIPLINDGATHRVIVESCPPPTRADSLADRDLANARNG